MYIWNRQWKKKHICTCTTIATCACTHVHVHNTRCSFGRPIPHMSKQSHVTLEILIGCRGSYFLRTSLAGFGKVQKFGFLSIILTCTCSREVDLRENYMYASATTVKSTTLPTQCLATSNFKSSCLQVVCHMYMYSWDHEMSSAWLSQVKPCGLSTGTYMYIHVRPFNREGWG